jgi:hypothetical protein
MRYMFITGLYSWFDIASDLEDIAYDVTWESDFCEEIEIYLANFSSTELSDIVENLKTEVEPERGLEGIAKANGETWGRQILGTRGTRIAIQLAKGLIHDKKVCEIEYRIRNIQLEKYGSLAE